MATSLAQSPYFNGIKKKANSLSHMKQVLEKLEKQNTIERLSAFLEDIFVREQHFAFTELRKIMNETSAQPSQLLLQQFEKNKNIFKSNFQVITQLTIDEVWEKVSQNMQSLLTNPSEQHEQLENGQATPPQLGDSPIVHAQQNTSERNGTEEEDLTQTGPTSIPYRGSLFPSSLLRSSIQSNSSASAANTNGNIHATNSPNSMNTSALIQQQLLQQQNQEIWVRQNMRQLSSSRSQERVSEENHTPTNMSQFHNRSQIQPNNNYNNKNNNNNSANITTTINKSNQSILDIKANAEKRMNNTNMSFATTKSFSTSKLNITSPFSEIQEPKNPLQSSFSRASRRLTEKEMSQSPSPGDYRLESAEKLVTKQSPKPSFGKTKRTSFVDSKNKMESNGQSPDRLKVTQQLDETISALKEIRQNEESEGWKSNMFSDSI